MSFTNKPHPPSCKLTDPEIRHLYLESLAATNLVGLSCEVAGISQNTLRNLRAQDPTFKTDEEDARERYRDVIRKEIHRRAIEGVPKDVYYQTTLTHTETVYSDRLLDLHARANCPEYKERSAVDLTLKGGVLAVPVTPASEEEWAASEGSDSK